MKLTEDVSFTLDGIDYTVYAPKKTFYGENDEEDEKLAKEYKTVLDGLYNLLVRYISNITGVVDGFAKYFSNIDKDTLKTSLVGYVSLQGNEDVAKHAKMIDKAVNKS